MTLYNYHLYKVLYIHYKTIWELIKQYIASIKLTKYLINNKKKIKYINPLIEF
jgi:hypothetical protein